MRNNDKSNMINLGTYDCNAIEISLNGLMRLIIVNKCAIFNDQIICVS